MQTATERQLNAGLLLIRLGVAATLLVYAIPRLIDGSPAWRLVARNIPFSHAGVSTHIVGLIVLCMELFAALGMLTGYLFRVSAVMQAIVYGLYCLSFVKAGHQTLPLYVGTLACVCIGLMLTGPGRFAVAVKIETK